MTGTGWSYATLDGTRLVDAFALLTHWIDVPPVHLSATRIAVALGAMKPRPRRALPREPRDEAAWNARRAELAEIARLHGGAQ